MANDKDAFINRFVKNSTPGTAMETIKKWTEYTWKRKVFGWFNPKNWMEQVKSFWTPAYHRAVVCILADEEDQTRRATSIRFYGKELKAITWNADEVV